MPAADSVTGIGWVGYGAKNIFPNQVVAMEVATPA